MNTSFCGLEVLNNSIETIFPGQTPPKIEAQELEKMQGIVTRYLPTISEPEKFRGDRHSVVVLPFPENLPPSSEDSLPFSATPLILALLTKREKLRDLYINEGSDHIIKLAIDLQTAKIIVAAVRRFKDRSKYADQLRRSNNCVEALRACQGPNVIPFYGVYEERGSDGFLKKRILFMEFCPQGDLLHAIGSLSEPEQISITRQLITAMGTVHGKDWTHADIKPDNVLLTQDSGVFLADFGYAATRYEKACGSPWYLAPEIVDSDRVPRVMPSHTTDLWSLGVTLLAVWKPGLLLNRLHSPHPLNNDIAVVRFLKIITSNPGHYQPKINTIIQNIEGIPETYRLLLLSLLQIDPSLRKIPTDCDLLTSGK